MTHVPLQAYNRKQSTSGSGVQQASKGEDDDADSDSTTSGSSTDLQTAGKANGAGGEEHSNTTDQLAASNSSAGDSNGAFDTSAIKNKLSVKRPPGGKVAILASCRQSLPPANVDCTSMMRHACDLQMSKKALMERAKDDRKKSETGDKSKGKPKVTHSLINAAVPSVAYSGCQCRMRTMPTCCFVRLVLVLHLTPACGVAGGAQMGRWP